jgi:LacI family repressor for deo operon, udp, cdd, tsx, nupC, and nupG
VTQTTIKEVAVMAGVSTATVSRCLNRPDEVSEPTRQRVEEAVRETGYRPNALARSFRRGRSNMVMVVLSSVGDPFFGPVMRGIRSVADEAGYSLIIDETAGNTITADEIGTRIATGQADGIILLAALSPFGPELVSDSRRKKLPIVIGCETMSQDLSQYPAVRVDNVAAAMDATMHLIGKGHRRIAMIYGLKSSLLTRDREKGYRAAMLRAGLFIDPEWIVEGKLTIEGAGEATRRLLAARRPPTAIFCANDEMAIGCMHAIKATGRSVPRDMSVIGFDDVPYAAVADPPLTTIRQPAEEIGRNVMRRLCREIDGDAPEDSAPQIMLHELIERQSVARWPIPGSPD